ncbi:hypothetical protein DQ04_04701030 [Trypanosoma grayi]|uniref:hypothetical protein n=1 Tax=Trypanosoma grayi TaxID=71804 RepID=UPI0004F41136|nr:hypothetical protein DQ04_04701030 [Trypanosoma grayi]KEG09758.1 hypothetical protein DQ04_04701030 [Trypanosoma grayi]
MSRLQHQQLHLTEQARNISSLCSARSCHSLQDYKATMDTPNTHIPKKNTNEPSAALQFRYLDIVTLYFENVASFLALFRVLRAALIARFDAVFRVLGNKLLWPEDKHPEPLRRRFFFFKTWSTASYLPLCPLSIVL